MLNKILSFFKHSNRESYIMTHKAINTLPKQYVNMIVSEMYISGINDTEIERISQTKSVQYLRSYRNMKLAYFPW